MQDQDIDNFVKDIKFIRSYLKDSVVLSKEEFSKALTDNFNMGKKEAQFYSERVAIPTTRKETAEKILQELWAEFEKPVFWADNVAEIIKELAKQFGVEIKENE